MPPSTRNASAAYPEATLQTSTTEWAEQLKAAAIAYRRASRAPWQNAHTDRQAREREARRVAKEYRAAQRLAAGSKLCSACQQTLPLDSFSPSFRDRPTARCKQCTAAATRQRYQSDLTKARGRTRNRPQATPEQRQKRAERQQRTADRRDQLAQERQRKTAERQRQTTERIAKLSALLMGETTGDRIATQERWDMTSSELRGLWLQSGDKECVSCKAVVPPTAILPPGPANFYPGRCHSCAEAESRENSFRVIGRRTEGPPLILMRDGTAITVAEFARRVSEHCGH